MKIFIFFAILAVTAVNAAENPVVVRIKPISIKEYRSLLEVNGEVDESQRSDSRFIGEALTGLTSLAAGFNLGNYINRLFSGNRETKTLGNYPLCTINAPGKNEGRQFDLSSYPSVDELIQSLNGQSDGKRGPPVINCVLVVDEGTTKKTTTRRPKTTTPAPDSGPTFQPLPPPPTYPPWYPGGHPGGYPGGYPGAYPGGYHGGYPGGHPGSYPPGSYPGGAPVDDTTDNPVGDPDVQPTSPPENYPGGNPGNYPGGQPGAAYPGGYPPYPYHPYGPPQYYPYVPYPPATSPDQGVGDDENQAEHPPKHSHSQALHHLLHLKDIENSSTTRRPRPHSGARPTRRRRVRKQSRSHPETSSI